MKFASKQYFDFLWAMTEKEIKARYKRAMFGFLWIILNPILQMIIIGIVFSYFIKIPNYFYFLFSGLLFWNFFSLSLTKVTPSIVYERTLLQKAKFPIEAIPLSIIFSNFFHTIISLFIFIPLLLINHLVDMGNLILLLPALLWLLFLTVSLSLLTATLNVKYRDVNFFVQTILVIWFYATPIIYDVVLIPKELILLLKFNPLTGIFELIHRALLNQGALDTSIILINLLITIIIFIVSFLIFRKENKYFVDWL